MRIAIIALAAVIALVLAGCGGDDDDGTAEATVPPATTTEAPVPPETTLPPKPSPELVRALKRDANTWASLFATNNCNRYMGQPICERLQCLDIENCKRVSAAFQESFADATVEGIEHKGTEQVGPPAGFFYLAAVKFSTGVVVVFSGGRPEVENPEGSCAGSGGDCTWNVLSGTGQNRRFVQAAAPLE